MGTHNQRPQTALKFDVIVAQRQLGWITRVRIQNAINSIVRRTKHYRVEPIALGEGKQVLLAGNEAGALDYRGIARRAMRYQNKDHPLIARALHLFSTGWRYDVYISDLLGRDVAASYIALGLLNPGFDLTTCSSKGQAFEAVLYDKKEGRWTNPTWYSIGHNRDTLASTPRSRLATPLMNEDTLRATLMETGPVPIAPAAEAQTRFRLEPSDAINRIKTVLQKSHGFLLTTEVVPVYSEHFSMLRFEDISAQAAYRIMHSMVELKYPFNGTERHISVPTTSQDKSKNIDIGNGYRAFVRAYPLVDATKQFEHANTTYIAIVTIVDVNSVPYGTFVAGVK